MLKKEFEVEGIVYVIKFDKNIFSLYVDGLKSKKQTSKIVIDDFNDFGNDDGTIEKVFYTGNLVKTKNPMKIYANVISFVSSVISKQNPYYFSYTANEKKKMCVYTAVAKKIAKKYGYGLLVEGKKFSFYKNFVDN